MCALGGDREDPAGHLPRFGLRGKARVLDSEDFAPANGRAKQLRKAACEVSVTFAHTFSVCDFRMWRLLNIHSGANECGSTKICGLMHLTKVYLSSGEKAIYDLLSSRSCRPIYVVCIVAFSDVKFSRVPCNIAGDNWHPRNAYP